MFYLQQMFLPLRAEENQIFMTLFFVVIRHECVSSRSAQFGPGLEQSGYCS